MTKRQNKKKLDNHIMTFSVRERRVYNHLVEQFTLAVKDMENLSKRLEKPDIGRPTRIADRMDNHVFTLRLLGVNIDYNRTTYKVEETVIEEKQS